MLIYVDLGVLRTSASPDANGLCWFIQIYSSISEISSKSQVSRGVPLLCLAVYLPHAQHKHFQVTLSTERLSSISAASYFMYFGFVALLMYILSSLTCSVIFVTISLRDWRVEILHSLISPRSFKYIVHIRTIIYRFITVVIVSHD